MENVGLPNMGAIEALKPLSQLPRSTEEQTINIRRPLLNKPSPRSCAHMSLETVRRLTSLLFRHRVGCECLQLISQTSSLEACRCSPSSAATSSFLIGTTGISCDYGRPAALSGHSPFHDLVTCRRRSIQGRRWQPSRATRGSLLRFGD